MLCLALTGCFQRVTRNGSGQALSSPGSTTGDNAEVPKGQVQLAWNAITGEQDGFNIEASPDGITYTKVATVTDVRAATITGLLKGKTYSFRISGYNSAGQSPYSAIITSAPQ
jgi:hypothetical protein